MIFCKDYSIVKNNVEIIEEKLGSLSFFRIEKGYKIQAAFPPPYSQVLSEFAIPTF